MSRLTPIDLRSRERNTDYYDKSRDMIVALAWNSVKKTLEEHGRSEIFEYIQSVRLTEKYIVITTGKPIVNAEIKLYTEDILTRFHMTTRMVGGQEKKGVRLG